MWNLEIIYMLYQKYSCINRERHAIVTALWSNPIEVDVYTEEWWQIT